jgi:hypothetical protein
MAEKLGEAILELRTDDRALEVGLAKGKAGAQDLGNTFVSESKRAEGALGGIGNTTKSVGAAATQLAAQAQTAAKASMAGAAGIGSMGAAGGLARIQLLELSHVGTSLAGAMIAGINPVRALAMEMPRIAQAAAMGGTGIKGLMGQVAQMAGLVKTMRDAELVEEAVNAMAAASAVEQAAKIAAAKVMAADVEIALAEAQLKSATTSDAEAAAQARLAAAHEAVAAAAEQARIAELALAAAQGRAVQAQEAEQAAAVTSLTTRGAVVAGAMTGVAIAGSVLVATIKVFQDQVRDSGELDRYANSLGLTKKEMKELRQEVGGLSSKEMKDLNERAKAFEITWGDVFNGLKKTASDALELSPAWKKFTQGAENAWIAVLKGAASASAHIYGFFVGAYQTIVDTWGSFSNAIGHAFVSAVNAAIGAINSLVKAGVDGLNGMIDQANRLPFVNLARLGTPQISQIADSYAKAGKAAGKSFAQNVAEATAFAQKQIDAQVATIMENIIGAAEKRIKDSADTIIEDRTPKKPKKERKQSDHGLAEALAELDAQIRGQYRLAAAYEVSDAAVVKAEALQKAEEDAIRHKSAVGVFYEKELAKAVATRAADAAKVIADMANETSARKALNDNVAAGLIPAAQMQQQLELEAKLRPLIVAYELADAKHKALIADEISRLVNGYAALNTQLSRAQMLQDKAAGNDELERLRKEASLIGASNRERAVALAQLEAIQRLRNMPGLSPQEQADYIKQAGERAVASVQTPFQAWAATIPQTADAINQSLESIAVKGFDGLADALTGVLMGTTSLKQAFHELAASILADLIKMTIKMMIFKALEAVGGGSFSGSTTLYAGGFATGGLIPAGMFGVVGERGPEPIIATPKGAMVMPNSTLRSGGFQSAGTQISLVNNNDFRGADPAAVAAITGRLDQMERDLPGRVVSTMQDAKQRFVWRR